MSFSGPYDLKPPLMIRKFINNIMVTFFDAFITIEFIWHSAIIIVNLCWSYAFHVTRQVLSRTNNFPSVVYFEMHDYTFWSSGSSLHIIYIKRQEKNFDVSLLFGMSL